MSEVNSVLTMNGRKVVGLRFSRYCEEVLIMLGEIFYTSRKEKKSFKRFFLPRTCSKAESWNWQVIGV